MSGVAGKTGADLAPIRALVENYARDVREHFGARVRGIRLYGSAARGDWTQDSDIDVLILLDRVTSEDEKWLVQRAFHLGVIENDLVLQPIFMSEEEFQVLVERERLWAMDIEREGVEL